MNVISRVRWAKAKGRRGRLRTGTLTIEHGVRLLHLDYFVSNGVNLEFLTYLRVFGVRVIDVRLA